VEPRIIRAKSPAAAPAAAPAVQVWPVDAEADGQRLDNWLLRRLKGVPKSLVSRVIRSGEVRVNQGRARADTRLAAGDRVRVPPLRLAERAPSAAPPREFAVLLEDDQLLAVDKPAGTAVHGGSGVSFGVIEQLRRARPEARFLELVHRLDKETSGILLLAKKRSALLALQAQFRQRETTKVYAALVAGDWPARLKVIDLPLLRTTDTAGERHVRVSAQEVDAARRSITLVRVVRRIRLLGLPFSLLDVTIKTGRTHQIRVHLAHHGHPIAGDPKYGDFALNRRLAREAGFGRMFLHARALALAHPADGRRIELESALPAECQALLDAP
jgi:23S rRNA pseudouridine955/2504/2580 synthase